MSVQHYHIVLRHIRQHNLRYHTHVTITLNKMMDMGTPMY